MDALWIFAAACGATALMMLCHALAARTTIGHGVPQLFLFTVCSIAVTAVAVFRFRPERALELPAVAALTLCFSLAYVHFYVALYRSLSIRILDELLKAGGTLTLEKLDAIYPLRWMYASRLQKLAENGWIACESGKYRSLPKGRRVAIVVSGLRTLYGIEKAG